MKKLIIALISFSSLLLANEFSSSIYQLNSDELAPQNSKETWKILPYAHVEIWMPGLGVCARIPREKAQIEFNVKAAHVPYLIDFYSGSISILPRVYKSEVGGQAYLGMGIGACYMGGQYGHQEPGINPMFPLFIGYEGAYLFSDLGVDALLDKDNHYRPAPFPTLRLGIKF